MSGEKKNKKANLMEKARAGLCYVNSQHYDKDAEIEAFMGIFHPEKQVDRKYMNKLKGAMKP